MVAIVNSSKSVLVKSAEVSEFGELVVLVETEGFSGKVYLMRDKINGGFCAASSDCEGNCGLTAVLGAASPWEDDVANEALSLLDDQETGEIGQTSL